MAVISGKGGAGKTSITAALAYELQLRGKKIIAIDTDVDAPNLALVLKGKLVDSIEASTSKLAKIDSNLCNNCGKCITYCKPEALIFQKDSKTPLLLPYLCEGCGICQIVCPQNAITLENRIDGWIRVYVTDYGFKLVMGELDIGGVASGKLVSETKQLAYSLIKEPLDLILIDGPPGSGCPVISTLNDVDYILFITEPTPTALHDLDRLIKIRDTFGIEAGAIINKFDIHKPILKKIEKHLKEKNIELYSKLPYDKIIPKSIVNGKPFPVLNNGSDISRKFGEIVEKIIKIL